MMVATNQIYLLDLSQTKKSMLAIRNKSRLRLMEVVNLRIKQLATMMMMIK